ncbi:hypothetical protein HYC85_017178 [Camellia sinensis]|uniref:Pre-mRNA polyadenylation factor Fip1 domain-containing protein n=1 Tax=Camellia sinensis TaxID=4442 RepID=A0A7J7H1W9_CAMSI|nr:hypothetical protein HYC85_017178 [Camellia sinensis]
MEDDDDEFGDLYTDVLRPLQSSALSQNRAIDLNIQSDDEDILLIAPNSNPNFNFTSSHQNQTLVFNSDNAAPELGLASSSDSHRNLNLNLDLDGKPQSQEVEKEDGLAEGVSNWGLGLPEPSVPRVLESGGDLKFPNLIDESGIDVVVEERADKDDLLVAKDECSLDKNDNFEKFDIEEVNTGIEDLGSEPVIPGLSIPGVSDAVDNRGDSNFVMRDVASGEGDDWDSDSEDDLQIVLNDNHGPMAMGKTGVMGSDDEDEDGDPLVIVGDTELGHQPMEEREWGEDAAQGADGERKELGDAAKVNGGVVVPPKIGYSNHPYHPYHSQFKYVRPGAALMPGAAPFGPGGVPGQVGPPVNMGPVVGRGRGDWRPTGIKNASPMQKGFVPGFGTPGTTGRGFGTTGRGFGSGLDFTLPSHKVEQLKDWELKLNMLESLVPYPVVGTRMAMIHAEYGELYEGKKMHLVRWETISLSKDKGGLGLGNIIARNLALLGEWLWRFPLESDSLWHSIIKSKFLSLKVGNGDDFPGLYRIANSHGFSISLLACSSSAPIAWNLSFARNLSNREAGDLASLLSRIEYLSLVSSLSDKLKSFMPLTVKVFIWSAVRGSILTNDVLQRRRPYRYLSPQWCIMCKEEGETLNHLFFALSSGKGVVAASYGWKGTRGSLRTKVLTFDDMKIFLYCFPEKLPTITYPSRPWQAQNYPVQCKPKNTQNEIGSPFYQALDKTTIFEVDVDSFEEKPWRLPGIDISDFFNFGLNEENWKHYCKQLEQLRLEATMQSKIRVYESGRTEQEYDPDLPPELAAAAGINDISSENGNLGKMDAGQSDIAKGSAHVRPPLPTGRAIQVETGYGERLPSIDTRPPRIRDSDAIIEDSADDDSIRGNDVTEQPEKDYSREDFRGSHEIECDVAEEETVQFDGSSRAYNGRKRELIERKSPSMNSVPDNLTEGDGSLPLPPLTGRDVGTLYEDRQTKGRTHDRSPNMTHSESTLDKRFRDNQKEGSVESIGEEHIPRLSSPVTVGSAEDLDVEHGDGLHDELVLAGRSSGMDREEVTLDARTTTDTRIDENPLPSVKKQKLSSRVEQSSLQEFDDGGDLKASRSSDNSKGRSGSSRDYQKLHDSVDEEVVERGHSTRMVNLKRPHGEDEPSVRSKGRDERHEMDKNRLVEKGREDAYSRRDWDPHLAHHLHRKTEVIDRRKERDDSEGAWQWQDEDPHGMRTRAEDTRKRERDDEIGSRHRNKVQESERMDKDEHLQLRKQFDNGNLRAHHDKDVRSRHREKEDNMRSRYENVDDLHRKRRKEEEHLRRDAEKEEILRGYRENSSHRKRERDDALDLRKRDEQVRTRDEDQHSARHKEESWIHRERGERQRERDERHMIKQSYEESLLKREREEERGGVRSARAAEDKARVSHARLKDEYKGADRGYQFKDIGRHGEQPKRRDRVEDGSLLQHRGWEDVHSHGNQLSINEKRQERASTRDRAITGSDNNRLHEKKT